MGSGENLAFPNACFDLVIFTLSLHHQNSKLALAEAVRVLRTEGEILIIEPTVQGEVQRAFSLVNSENQELKNAQRAINENSLKIHNSEVFNATWSFENKENLCQSIFNFYKASFDNQIASDILTLIGAKAEDEPLYLLDELSIQCIQNTKKQPG